MSEFLSMRMYRVRLCGYSSRPERPTCPCVLFLLDLIGPCLVGHLEGVTLATSSKYCLATLALSKMILAERGSEVEPEVEGTASGGRFAKAIIIREYGKVFLSMFPNMTLPGRGTIPMHFRVFVTTTINTGQSNI